MFGTEIHWVTFTILVVQIAILPFLYINYLYDKSNLYRKRFLYLTIVFIIYNFFSGLFPDVTIPIPTLIQNLIAYGVGILYVLYFVYYIYNEFHITPFKYFSVKSIFTYLISLFIFLFVIPLILGYDLNFTRKLFIFIPLVLAIIYSFKTSLRLLNIYQKESINNLQKHYKLRIISANIGVFSLLTLPIIVFIGDYQYIEQPLVNLGYFVMLNVYIKNQIRLQRANQEIISNYYKTEEQKQPLDTFNLTTKEKEVAALILKNYKYKDIAELMFITEKTVSKHASNIFKKTNVSNRNDFKNKINN